jgi:predicted nuclease with TOPRIM domain
MIPEENKKKQQTKRTLLIIAVVALLLINAVKFYLDYLSSKKKDNLLAQKERELQVTYQRIDSISKELELKLFETKKLGGNIDSLIVIQIQLEKDKKLLQGSYEDLKEKYSDITDRLEGYTTLLQHQDEEIERLKKVNALLLTENTGLKTEKVKLSDSIVQLKQTEKKLIEKIEIASALKAENITINALNERGKERDGGVYKAKHIDQLKITFNLAENNVTKIEGKDIYVVIRDQRGEPFYNINTGSGTFIYQNKEIFYTSKQNILFDNTKQVLTFLYKKGNDYTSGTYTIDIYADGDKIGTSSFVIK